MEIKATPQAEDLTGFRLSALGRELDKVAEKTKLCTRFCGDAVIPVAYHESHSLRV